MRARRYGTGSIAALLPLLVAAACAAAFPATALAHTVFEGSTPEAGASVPESPKRIVLAFSEAPEVDLSIVKLLDSSGAEVAGVTAAQAVGGDPAKLEVTPSQPLADGVYTVNWRVVSAVDGHVQSGAFAFGVGQKPAPGSEVVVELLHTSPWASGLSAAGRWLLYAGLILIVGAASTSLLVYAATVPRGGVVVLRVAVLVAVVGLCLMVWAEKMLVGALSLLPLFLTREGHLLLALGVALLFCVLALAAVDLWPARWSLWLLGAAGSAAMLAHVLAGHAMSPVSAAPLNVALQWVHLTALGVWVGGLLWLVLGLRGRDGDARAAAVAAFVRVATITLAVVLATGVGRALSEVGSVANLVDTDYGIALLVKLALVTALVALGALNHFFWAPQVRRGDAAGPRRFARNSRGELAVALGVLAATAVLTGLAPAVTARAAAPPIAPEAMSASGQDYATTVEARLTVTPGRAGENEYRARIDDVDTGEPATGVTGVRLECSLPADPAVSAIVVPLRRAAEGDWVGRGFDFAIAGVWEVTALVERSSGGVTVPLSLPIRPAAL